MASFDPSIISQIPDYAGNPLEARSKAFKLADLMTQQQSNKLVLESQKQGQEEEKQAKAIWKISDPTTQEGRVAMAQKFANAGLGKYAMQSLQFSGEQQARDIETQKGKMQVMQLAADVIGPEAMQMKQIAQTQGYPAAQAYYQKHIAELMQQVPSEFKASIPPQLPPDPVQGMQMIDKMIQRSQQARQMLQQQLNQRKEDTAEARLTETERHNRANEDRQARTAAQNAGSDQDLEANAKAIANYQEAPPALSSRNPKGYKVMARVMELNPDYDANQYKTKGSSERAFAIGKQGDTVRSLNVAVQHLNLLSDAAKDLNNKDIRTVNRFYNAIGKEFGQPNVTNFEAAKSIVSDEVVKAVIGSGAGSLTDREDLQAKFSSASTPAQLAGVIQTAKGLMAGQLKGLKQQYESGTGRKDFDSKIAPETQSELGGGGVKPFSDPAKEARYQAWLKAHPNG